MGRTTRALLYATIGIVLGGLSVAPVALEGQRVAPEPRLMGPPTARSRRPANPASFFLGYAGNLPRQQFGVAFGRIRESHWGFYVDVKVSLDVPGSATDDYYEDLTVDVVEAWGHERRDEKTGYFSLNLGTIRRVGLRFAVYGATGLTAVQRYGRYHDPGSLLGSDGLYWIDMGGQRVRPNLMLGVLSRTWSRLLLQVGAETRPGGVTFGAAWLMS